MTSLQVDRSHGNEFYNEFQFDFVLKIQWLFNI